jgi:uncharacterized membrane protein YcaP (DUF421 family)
VRAAAAVLFQLFLLRTAGRRAIRHGTTFDFVLALILGDMVDDVLWSEVPFAQFAVATSTLILAKLGFTLYKKPGGQDA